MNCSKCGRESDIDSNFCKYCGSNLNRPITEVLAADPNYTIFENPHQPAKINTELGYLIISVIILVNISIWFSWGLLFGSGMRNDILYKGLRTLSTIFSIGQFVVMFIFAKRQTYRIVIGIIGAVVTLYHFYYLIDSLSRF